MLGHRMRGYTRKSSCILRGVECFGYFSTSSSYTFTTRNEISEPAKEVLIGPTDGCEGSRSSLKSKASQGLMLAQDFIAAGLSTEDNRTKSPWPVLPHPDL